MTIGNTYKFGSGMYPYPTNMGEPAFAGSIPTPQEAALMQEANARRQHMLSATRQRDLDAALTQKAMIEQNAYVPQTFQSGGGSDALDMTAGSVDFERSRRMQPSAELIESITPTTATGNARGSTVPTQTIGNNEMLMRVGGAMLSGARQGGLNSYSKGLDAYGQIQDYNREGERLAYQDETARIKADAKNKGGARQTDPNAGFIVNDEVGIAMDILAEDSNGFFSNLMNLDMPAAGGIGNLLKNSLWDSDAKRLKVRLETIQANIGFDKLQNMRDLSPTGGALGQVSERELAFLQQTFGYIDQSATSEDLYYNLARLQYHYNNTIHGRGNHQYKMPKMSDFRQLQRSFTTDKSDFSEEQNKLLDKYK